MKKTVFCLMAIMFCAAASAQRLIPVRSYGTDWGSVRLLNTNKPNGYIYRLRHDVRNSDLQRVEGTENLEMIISEPIDLGWIALYRTPMGSSDYSFVAVTYDSEGTPLRTFDLCDITGINDCEVQDIRWDPLHHYLLFNMACVSYSSSYGGRCSRLFCYDTEASRLLWQSDYLVSNDIFIINDKYVFCSYGFTNERDYLYMLDLHTGKQYSKLPMLKSVDYLELQEHNGREVLYAVDYDDRLYEYAVSDTSASPRKKARKGGKKKR